MHPPSILQSRFGRRSRVAFTAALIAFVASAVLPATATAQAPDENNEPFVGTWADTVGASGVELRPIFRIRHGDDGALAITVDDPTVGISSQRAHCVTSQGDSLTLDWGFFRFEGALAAGGSRIGGMLAIAGRSYPVTMRPAGDSLPAPPPRPQRPEATPADVKSPDAIVSAYYDAVSVAGQEKTNWDRIRSLFLPEARLIRTDRSEGRRPWRQEMTVEQWVNEGRLFAQRFVERGFVEKELHAETERFGDIANVFSTYEAAWTTKSSDPERGINNFQLWHDGDRWWIVSIVYHSERKGAPLPERYEK